MKPRGTPILGVIGLGLALSASIPFFASQAAPSGVVQADSLPTGVSSDGLEQGAPASPTQWHFNTSEVQERCVGGFFDLEADLPGVNHSS